MRRTLRLLALALPIAAAACLGADPVAPAPDIEDVTFAPALGVDLASSTETTSGLWYRDITVGTGASFAVGDSVYFTYAGHFPNGSQFDAGTGQRGLFRVGTLITGFNEGVTGMRVGGRRQLIIPPHLGYGSGWYGNVPPNSVLVFDVRVDSIKAPTTE